MSFMVSLALTCNLAQGIAQSSENGMTSRINGACFERSAHGATGLEVVAAVAEAALTEQWPQFDKPVFDGALRQVVQAEFLQAR